MKAILTVILGAILAVTVAGCAYSGDTPDPLDAVRVESTRQAVALEATATALDLERQSLDLERDTRRQAAMDPFVLALPWIVLVAGLGAAGLVFWRWLQVWEARARLVHRAPEAGETILALGRGERFALPLRSAGVYQDLSHGQERAPMLAHTAEAQEAAVMRAQTANLALASQAAETVKGRAGGDVYLLPHGQRERTATTAPSPVRVLPEPTETVKGWIVDTERALLPEVISDGTSD